MTVEGSPLETVQRKLTAKENPPGDIVDYGYTNTSSTVSTAVGMLTVDYVSGDDGFDFTDFMTYQLDEIDLIAALGGGVNMAFHSGGHIGGMKLTRSSTCTCSSEPTTTAAANMIFNGIYVILAVFIAFLWM